MNVQAQKMEYKSNGLGNIMENIWKNAQQYLYTINNFYSLIIDV